MLENEIIPLYFAKNSKGYSPEWIQYIKRSIGHIAPHFTMQRQLDDYFAKFYIPESRRTKALSADNFAKAREIAAWKEEVAEKWEQVQVLSSSINDADLGSQPRTGSEFEASCEIDTKGLGDAIGVEIVVYREQDGERKFLKRCPLKVVKREGDVLTHWMKEKLQEAGMFNFAFRMYPFSKDIPHRQDFAYVRWF